jgi:streptogrisin C
VPRNRRFIISLITAGAVTLSAGAVATASVIAEPEPAEPGFVSAAQGAPEVGAETAAAQAATGPSAAAPAAPAATATAAPDPSTIDAPGSIAYLRQRYGVSEAEARRRLTLQQSSAALAGRLAAAYPDEYAGMWLDQAGGGVLRIAATKPERLAPALAKASDAAHVKPVTVARSLRQLEDLAAKARAALGGTPDDVSVAVDPITNQVVVAAENQVRTDDPRVDAALRSTGGAGRVLRRPAEVGVPKSACFPVNCPQTPIRSGIRLDVPRDDATVGGCTTGWSLRSRSTGDYYVLTAGHCVVPPPPPAPPGRHTRIDDTFHLYNGPRIPMTVEPADETLRGQLGENIAGAGSAYDYAVMPYQNAAAATRWLGLGVTRVRRPVPLQGLINYWCPPADAAVSHCSTSREIRVGGMVPLASVQPGWVVCATGAGYTPKTGENYVDSGADDATHKGYVPGTHCGEVLTTDVLIKVRICARPGDSGGPLFTEADGRALGILKFGDSRHGACIANDAEVNYYSPLSSILQRVNSRTSLQLDLVVYQPIPAPPPRRHP